MNARLQTTAPQSLTLTADQSIGQIAVQLPGATAIFRRLKLDFCCGGHLSLQQASQDKGLDAEAVMSELRALQHPTELPAVADVVGVNYLDRSATTILAGGSGE